ncbi:fumarylacetoacetase [Lentimicrobium sp.]|uniref:fumarylacetoacetase n=1 Tax=Lentimicrobium sp. TaxID=2034841 RepID=UPI002C17AC95|nr:fumarylacetoacetase [Lentimicrobium sp.]HOP12440.1 fumarylacetoacetase [Lentimicrobium sp.]
MILQDLLMNLKSWIEIPAGSDFPLENLPFGIGRSREGEIAAYTRIGDTAVNLAALDASGVFTGMAFDYSAAFRQPVLNDFIAMGKAAHRALRKALQAFFAAGNKPDATLIKSLTGKVLFPAASVEMLMPVKVTDYTDFYSSIEHATNVGKMFRDPANALLPNWRHLPVGYHGRASSIVISGTDIRRPRGQTMPAGADAPVFGPSKMLDFELEMAFVVGKSTSLGEPVAAAGAEDYIFGFLLFNDLSARDIQSWEYVPLGPFLSKNFGSVVSPWIVTLEALEPFRVKGPEQEPGVLPYLKTEGLRNFDINLEVLIRPENGDENVICRSNFRHMYWNICQQLAHHTVNGCNINTGDLYASGTISGPDPGSYGSMLELTWRGTHPIRLSDGTERKFVNDHDAVIMRGYAERDGLRIGFGECTTKILPALT